MRRIPGALLALVLSGPAVAEVPSVLGGKLVPAGTTAHNVGAGIPGIYYEWWQGGWDFDWAFHGGLVYEHWSGAWFDVQAGLELELPMRFRLGGGDSIHVAFRVAPGLLVADAGTTVLGVRGDVGAVVSVDVHPRANLVTGVTAPVTVVIPVGGGDNGVLVPVLGRLGLESFASSGTAVFLLLELGPVFRVLPDVGRGQDRAKLGSRFWLGVTFYM